VKDPWNKCDVCGRFIPYCDFEKGDASHKMITPDSDVSYEQFETFCKNHNQRNTMKKSKLTRQYSLRERAETFDLYESVLEPEETIAVFLRKAGKALAKRRLAARKRSGK